ncbi:hypothetical protein ACOMCU_01390 [Lysinibacillus sp. UGB7]|uniref:hypothetical protein n=1 Tax=Lysinibacillus sp. UGB7 TaxID=3411039 RepID=UPI003B7F51BC
MKILNFEKVMQKVENGEVVEMVAYKNFHYDGDFNLLYCKQGHCYTFRMLDEYYAILKPHDNGMEETVVVFKKDRYQNAERADLKRFIEDYFCEPLQGDVFVEIKKIVKSSADVDHINQGLRKIHNQHEFSISNRSSINLPNGEQVVCIVGQIKSSKLSAICEIFSEVVKMDEKINTTGYTIFLDVDIAEYDFYTNGI